MIYEIRGYHARTLLAEAVLATGGRLREESGRCISFPRRRPPSRRTTGGSDRLLNDDYANDRSEVDGNTFTITPPKR